MKTALLNCGIVTGGEGTYDYKKITVGEAKKEIKSGYISAIGHQSTATVLSTLLGQEIPANRIQFRQKTGQKAVVFSLKRRIEEGRILSAKEIEEVGYDMFLMTKVR